MAHNMGTVKLQWESLIPVWRIHRLQGRSLLWRSASVCCLGAMLPSLGLGSWVFQTVGTT
ncbi:hypothetical protein [Neosynechococcus sphagnicola]|uniref:hypothetical protein n=1 Tax=Neosynechococcus sphagnicola TaxID=1501145 RepID=UPI0019554663|nr:hypothetical protein [Neosynechococcus sphagnicola]